MQGITNNETVSKEGINIGEDVELMERGKFSLPYWDDYITAFMQSIYWTNFVYNTEKWMA